MDVLSDGRKKGILNNHVDEPLLLDFIIGVITRVVSMWIVRGQQTDLMENANELFDMVWRGISNPERA